jgi:hypothetical protein
VVVFRRAPAACLPVRHLREKATLKLDNGAELRVELDSEDLATAKRHPAGTNDRLLEADRERPY